jgi:hypothetical protein
MAASPCHRPVWPRDAPPAGAQPGDDRWDDRERRRSSAGDHPCRRPSLRADGVGRLLASLNPTVRHGGQNHRNYTFLVRSWVAGQIHEPSPTYRSLPRRVDQLYHRPKDGSTSSRCRKYPAPRFAATSPNQLQAAHDPYGAQGQSARTTAIPCFARKRNLLTLYCLADYSVNIIFAQIEPRWSSQTKARIAGDRSSAQEFLTPSRA